MEFALVKYQAKNQMNIFRNLVIFKLPFLQHEIGDLVAHRHFLVASGSQACGVVKPWYNWAQSTGNGRNIQPKLFSHWE